MHLRILAAVLTFVAFSPAHAQKLTDDSKNTFKQEVCACINQFLPGGSKFDALSPNAKTHLINSLRKLAERDSWIKGCLNAEFKEEPDVPAPLPEWFRDLEALWGLANEWGVEFPSLDTAFKIMNGLQCAVRYPNMIDKFVHEQANIPESNSIAECKDANGKLPWPGHPEYFTEMQRDIARSLCADWHSSGTQPIKGCRNACASKFNKWSTFDKVNLQCIDECTSWCLVSHKGTHGCELYDKLPWVTKILPKVEPPSVYTNKDCQAKLADRFVAVGKVLGQSCNQRWDGWNKAGHCKNYCINFYNGWLSSGANDSPGYQHLTCNPPHQDLAIIGQTVKALNTSECSGKFTEADFISGMNACESECNKY